MYRLPSQGPTCPMFCLECLTCNVDVLRLVLSREIKSRGGIFILHKPKPKGGQEDTQIRASLAKGTGGANVAKRTF